MHGFLEGPRCTDLSWSPLSSVGWSLQPMNWHTACEQAGCISCRDIHGPHHHLLPACCAPYLAGAAPCPAP